MVKFAFLFHASVMKYETNEIGRALANPPYNIKLKESFIQDNNIYLTVEKDDEIKTYYLCPLPYYFVDSPVNNSKFTIDDGVLH